jgi:uncharacterized protein YbaR (Trm112 family)
MRWLLRACPACAGDLHEDTEDEDQLVCFLCSRSYPLSQLMPRLVTQARASSGDNDEALRPAA